MSLFVKEEEAPAFNFLVRVLTPIAYLFVIAAILYTLKLDEYVYKIYLVNIYYILIRLIINIITNRYKLLNWFRQSIYWLIIITLSYTSYTKLISHRETLLPEISSIVGELWIIIIIFIYQILNNIRFSSEGTRRRKNNYLSDTMRLFKKKYENTINQKVTNDNLKGLIYAILIIEDFNRPRIIRIIEYITFFITKKPHTLGIMQYYSDVYITNNESIELGIKKILDGYSNLIAEENNEHYYKYQFRYDLANIYNTGHEYSYDVVEMWDQIMAKFYPDTLDKLYESR